MDNFGRSLDVVPGPWVMHENGSMSREVTPVYCMSAAQLPAFELGQDNGCLLDLAEIQRDLLWSMLEEVTEQRVLNALGMRTPDVPLPFILRAFLEQLHQASFSQDDGPFIPDVARPIFWMGHILILRDYGQMCRVYTHEGVSVLLKELEDPHDD